MKSYRTLQLPSTENMKPRLSIQVQYRTRTSREEEKWQQKKLRLCCERDIGTQSRLGSESDNSISFVHCGWLCVRCLLVLTAKAMIIHLVNFPPARQRKLSQNFKHMGQSGGRYTRIPASVSPSQGILEFNEKQYVYS